MRPLNLYSIYKIIEQCELLQCNLLVNALQKIDYLNIRKQEFKGLDLLIEDIYKLSNNFDIFNGFFMGFKIHQISKEFDLLKIWKSKIINIELKSNSTVEKSKKQLISNQYYLNNLKREMHLFTYISSNKTLYYLNQENELIKTDVSHLLELLKDVEDYETEIENLFLPSEYLVSPLNTPARFLKRKYFLTDMQLNILKDFKDKIDSSHISFYKLEGKPGTGKTLLLFDMAIELSKTDKVCIVHCGITTEGHRYIDENSDIDIIAIKEIRSKDISKYNIIFFDESHRMFGREWNYLCDKVFNNDQKYIFSMDPEQIMSTTEQRSNTAEKISNLPNLQSYKLTDRIRTNPNITNFIIGMLDLSKKEKIKNTDSIDIYFSRNNIQSKNIIRILQNNGYIYIKFTPSIYYQGHMDKMPDSINSHQVIGQEFDNVVVVITDDFYYYKDVLIAKKHPNPDYLYVKLFYQSATRAKNKLAIIVENNINVLSKVLEIV